MKKIQNPIQADFVIACFEIFVSTLRELGADIATGYGLDDRGVGVPVQVGSRIFSSPQHPDWF
jgi:hypothetical protein